MDGKQENTDRKSVQLALDAVEMGEEPPEQARRKQREGRQKLILPSGITYNMLFGDVVRIALPAFVEMVLAQLVSMADMMMVGQISPEAISAVGICTQPIMLLQMVFLALNVGTTALVSRYKGEGDMHRANSVMRHALLITAVLSVLFSVVGYVFAGDMIRFMGATDQETFVAGVEYMQIRMIGFLPMTLTTVVTASLRGVGDSRTAMIYNLQLSAHLRSLRLPAPGSRGRRHRHGDRNRSRLYYGNSRPAARQAVPLAQPEGKVHL